jgi:opacity protein-like surface antigen
MRLMKISDPGHFARRYAAVITAGISNPEHIRRRFPMPRGLRVTPLLLVVACVLSTASFPCNAQNAPTSPKFTLDLGGGWAGAYGKYSQGLKSGYNLRGSVGVAVYRPETEYDDKGKPVSANRLSIYLTATFLFNQSGFQPGVAVETAGSNPQNPNLLSATGGRVKFFSATFGPTFRCRTNGPVKPYFFGGLGWMRREAQITGESVEGVIYQPSGPVVGVTGGNSGAFAAGAGVDFGHINAVGGMKFFAEARVLHGIGINSGTTFAPGAGIRW